jgi:hypothetical protein
MIDWYLETSNFGSCNCDYSCPCQFEALPTLGNCRGFEAVRIDKGHFGEVDLTGLYFAVTYAWPGPVFEGGGELQAIIDERADEAQRSALKSIITGKETLEAATHWWVFHAMSETMHETLYKPIEFEWDYEGRLAKVSIPGILESAGEPIRNPWDGGEHRVRIQVPEGIEFEIAEIGSAKTRATGAISLDLKKTYGQFNSARHTGAGPVRD